MGSNKWNVFKSKGLHLIHRNISSLFPKRYIANSSNADVIGISESKLEESVPQSEIQINNYDLLLRDRNRNEEGVAWYVRSENTFLKKSKIFS